VNYEQGGARLSALKVMALLSALRLSRDARPPRSCECGRANDVHKGFFSSPGATGMSRSATPS